MVIFNLSFSVVRLLIIFLNWLDVYSLLTFALFLMLFAFLANVSVLIVSSRLVICGEQHTTTVVFVFPPKLSCKRYVSFDERKAGRRLFPISFITVVSCDNERLIDFNSLNCLLPSLTPVFRIDSLPAR